ncbi:MAG: 3-hydroxyacyl-ACP dehydratase FabZ [Nitrospirae bacterium]|uniref:3-hydroxyacyl-ACP dehydratase FabZ n=1 Tax=Candidatus Magnetobacterium casense TaxID=1455061 RepID=UPI00058DADE1|nr:3-hydroxyacyl-ACP dehydratase FabZ [Candidatus Magnetobacterium casensis]MBF0336240.1 3-hydroxyacyl-ACP dehydratase FabZ [Nitrospirota bacterium]
MNDVRTYIPHREPFLFVDEIVEIDDKSIKTKKYIGSGEYFFKGHYPGYPVMPGVLMCEAMMQSGAILIAHCQNKDLLSDVPVVSKINNVKFKNMVLPDSTIEMHVELTDKISSAYYLKGKAFVNSKVVVSMDFACALVKKGENT